MKLGSTVAIAFITPDGILWGEIPIFFFGHRKYGGGISSKINNFSETRSVNGA